MSKNFTIYSRFLLALFAYGFASTLHAEPINNEQVVIEGDVLENILDRKLKASGNAILSRGNQSVEADVIEYDQVSEELYAYGNVLLKTKSSQIEGTELELSLDSNTGSIPNASFISSLNARNPKFNNTLRGTASLIFLEGESKKRLQNASITTCEAGQNDWFINASELEINERSQRVDATNAELEFKGFPILYSPYVNFSFNDDRKSGFLVPSIGSSSRSGFEAAIPYYFNLSPTSDATVTPRYFGRRGTQVSGEYRYLDQKYSGVSQLDFMPSDTQTTRDNRYYVKLKHVHDLGNGFTAGYNVDKVSDDNYFADMSSLISVTSQVNLNQEAFLNYSDNDWNARLLTQKFQNLTTSSPYERLPSLTVNHGKIFEDEYGFTDYEVNTNFSLTQFERNNNFTGVSPRGTRVTTRPSLSIPFERPYGFVTPKLSMDMKYYDLNDANVTSKDLYIPTLSFDSGLYLDKKISFKESTFTQTLEPRIFYSYTPYEDQSMLPMFDTALIDLNAQSIFSENQFVGGDRVMDSHQVTVGGTTRFIDSYGMERLSGTIAQRFYIDDRKVLNESQFNNSSAQNDSSDLFVSASALIAKGLKLNVDTQYNLDESSTNRATIGAKYNPRSGKLLNASYRFVKNPANSEYDVKQINIAGQWPLGSGWSSVGRYNYDIKSSSTIEGLAGVEFDAGCWSASVLMHAIALATTEKRNTTMFFMLELGGLGSLGTGSQGSLTEVLDRNVPGSFGLDQLPESYRNENQK